MKTSVINHIIVNYFIGSFLLIIIAAILQMLTVDVPAGIIPVIFAINVVFAILYSVKL